MPCCKKESCNNVQNKLNKGGLCKQCFQAKINAYNNASKKSDDVQESPLMTINEGERDIIDLILKNK